MPTSFDEDEGPHPRSSRWARSRHRRGRSPADEVDAPGFEGQSLPQKILGLHRAFSKHGIPYAFGGAIALAYHAEPRATDDIDVNILMPPERGADVVAALDGLFVIEDRAAHLATIASRDQTRLLWDRTYVDLFFMDTAFHESLATRTGDVAFGDESIAVISAEDLVVCKALFNRPHDWVDIQRIATIQGGGLDRSYVDRWLRYFVGGTDAILDRFRELRDQTGP